jgi:hypothetical protein
MLHGTLLTAISIHLLLLLLLLVVLLLLRVMPLGLSLLAIRRIMRVSLGLVRVLRVSWILTIRRVCARALGTRNWWRAIACLLILGTVVRRKRRRDTIRAWDRAVRSTWRRALGDGGVTSTASSIVRVLWALFATVQRRRCRGDISLAARD